MQYDNRLSTYSVSVLHKYYSHVAVESGKECTLVCSANAATPLPRKKHQPFSNMWEEWLAFRGPVKQGKDIIQPMVQSDRRGSQGFKKEPPKDDGSKAVHL